jgi:hypothetical protein
MTNWKERIQNNYTLMGLPYKKGKPQWPKSQMVKNINKIICCEFHCTDIYSIT